VYWKELAAFLLTLLYSSEYRVYPTLNGKKTKHHLSPVIKCVGKPDIFSITGPHKQISIWHH